MSNEVSTNGSPAPPVSPPVTKRKKAGLLVSTLVVLWGIRMGWSGWSNSTPKPEPSYAQWQDKTIAPRVEVLRQRLAAIESRPDSNVDDYIANTLETWPIVDEAKGLIREQKAMIARFRRTYSDNVGDERVADHMMKLTEKDEQLMSLLAEEIECAKRLKALPAPQRLAYYNSNVPPIKEKEKQVMNERLAVVNDAKANGVPLPPNVDQSAAQPDKKSLE
jgi:hypothetical protein